MLAVREIETFYGQVKVLKQVSLEVPQGGIVTVLGSNGAGKTTTLKTISGVVNPRRGSIVFGDRHLEKLAAYDIVKLGICHVPEGRLLFQFMTVNENLEMGSYGRSDRAAIRDDLQRAMELFPVLRERRGQLARTLSGGEQQMLAIARGLMSRPRLMLLDEPSLGLAPLYVQKLFEIIKGLNQEGMTILLVEQNAHLALQIADYGYIMETGEITLSGPAKDLMNDQNVIRLYLGR